MVPQATMVFIMRVLCLLVFPALARTFSSQFPIIDHRLATSKTDPEFKLKEGPDVFTPRNLVQLTKPGVGVANPDGDLVLILVSKSSLEDKKYVRRLLQPSDG